MIDVKADDHELLERDFDGPDFAAQLAVELNADFSSDGHEHLGLAQRLRQDALRRQREVHATQLLDRVVTVLKRYGGKGMHSFG